VTVAAIAPPALAAFFQVREVADGRAVAGELFRYRYREQAPDFPHHVVGFWRDPDGVEHPACYIHFTALGEVLLGGGACTDPRLLRRLPPDQRGALRAAGGVYQHCLAQAVQLFAPRYPAIFGYCGDALAERVDRAVGFQPTGHRHLLVYFTRPLPPGERARLVALAHAVGPF
jgi:hypothetical protein